MNTIPLTVAFGAGLISFLSPCVLPLVPGYLSFVSGVNVAAARLEGDTAAIAQQRVVLANALLFVCGFSTVFVLLGASATALGSLLLTHLPLLGKIAGALLVLFGLHMTGLLPLKFLYQEKRLQLSNKPLGFLGAFVVGCAFAFGWTPCIGPVLAGILTVAGQEKTLWEGVALLACYSAGLGTPFLLAAAGIHQFYRFFDRFKHHLRKVEVASGLLLMAIGVLMFTGSLAWLSGLLGGGA